MNLEQLHQGQVHPSMAVTLKACVVGASCRVNITTEDAPLPSRHYCLYSTGERPCGTWNFLSYLIINLQSCPPTQLSIHLHTFISFYFLRQDFSMQPWLS